jgi:integrase/recombinase XerC
MATPKPDPLPFADKDVSAEIRRWLGHLGDERRMSPKTCEAYRRDVHQFLAFLAEHLGQRVTLGGLSRLAPADVRAFMAARRNKGIAGRSLMRGLAGARSFARFLERDHKGKVAALSAVRAPRVAKTLPKPLGVAAATRITDTELRAGEEREPWVLARDAAVLRCFMARACASPRRSASNPGTSPARAIR